MAERQQRVWGAWGMPPRLLALAVLGLIWVHATASLAHAEVVNRKIPFRYAPCAITHKDSGPSERRLCKGLRSWRTRASEGWLGWVVHGLGSDSRSHCRLRCMPAHHALFYVLTSIHVLTSFFLCVCVSILR